jgi:spore germination protein GerM
MATLYFPSGETGLLAPESREILATPAAGDRARQILSDLLSGPTQSGYLAAAPPGTRLLQVYVLLDGTAYADFSAELRSGIDAGSEPEILTVYSIVNSLAFNIPEIDRVGILVQGRACDSLNGHLDLRRPLRPNWRIIDRDGGASTPSDEPRGEPAPPGQVVRHGPMMARRG